MSSIAWGVGDGGLGVWVSVREVGFGGVWDCALFGVGLADLCVLVAWLVGYVLLWVGMI